jgi:hypothetical protein
MVKPVSGACNAHQALSTIPATHVLLSSASSPGVDILLRVS